VFVRIEPETGTNLANSPRTKLSMRTRPINNNSISPITMLTVRVKLDRVIKNLVEWANERARQSLWSPLHIRAGGRLLPLYWGLFHALLRFCPTLSRAKILYTFHVLLRIAAFLKATGYGDSTIFCYFEETPQFVRSSLYTVSNCISL
jgi:hypothetical protein